MCQECGRWQQMAEQDGARIATLESQLGRTLDAVRTLADSVVALQQDVTRLERQMTQESDAVQSRLETVEARSHYAAYHLV